MSRAQQQQQTEHPLGVEAVAVRTQVQIKSPVIKNAAFNAPLEEKPGRACCRCVVCSAHRGRRPDHARGRRACMGRLQRTHTHTSRSIWTNMSPVQPLSWKHIRLPNVPQAYHATENKLELVLGISELILLPLAQISDCIYSGNHHTCNSEWQRGVTRVALG